MLNAHRLDADPAAATAGAGPFTVGRWRADPATDTLALDGREVKLEPRTMRLLQTLAARAGEVCDAGSLLDAVWPGVVVTGHSLYQAIGVLRGVLKADAHTPEFIVNVPRKGYRLVAPVGAVAAAPGPAVPLPAAPAGATRAIAVLPFRDLGLPPDLAFLCETLLAELVLELSRQPGLTTIARGTMLSYRGQVVAPRRLADELGVRHVVDGTIAALGDRLVIACELIDTASGTVQASESVELPAGDWPEAGWRVAGRLARALRLEVNEQAARAIDRAAPADASALELAMRAWVELYGRPQRRETNERAWAWAAEALRRDDSIGAAWNVMAYCEWRAGQYGWHERPRAALMADALAHAERATALSPNDPDAHYTLALVMNTGRDIVRSEATLRHCLAISASYAPAWGLLGLARAQLGHPEETAGLCGRALALSPREPLRAVWHWSEALALSLLGRDGDALSRATLGLVANPDYPLCHLIAAISAWRMGRRDDALRHAEALRASSFCSIEQVLLRLPAAHIAQWGPGALADLRAAGLPER